jgi:AraC-like DNA-binding protein
MPYSPDKLFHAIAKELDGRPRASITELSKTFGVSRGTIGKVVTLSSGVSFRKFQENLLMCKIRHQLLSKPTCALKELSFALGFSSPHSFARFIKRVAGQCPHELRSVLAQDIIRTAEQDVPTKTKYSHRLEIARRTMP